MMKTIMMMRKTETQTMIPAMIEVKLVASFVESGKNIIKSEIK